MQIQLLGLNMYAYDDNMFSRIKKQAGCDKSDIYLYPTDKKISLSDTLIRTIVQDSIRIELSSSSAVFFIEDKTILTIQFINDFAIVYYCPTFSCSALEEIICKKVIPLFYYKTKKGLPLHATAILSENGVVCLSGISKAGKSTLAANLCLSNLGSLITDDILCLQQIDNELHIYPSMYPLKLRDDSKKYFLDKFNLKNMPDYVFNDISQDLILKTIFFIKNNERCNFTVTEVEEKLNTSLIIKNLFAPDFCDFGKDFLEFVMNISKTIKLNEITIPRSYEVLDEISVNLIDYITTFNSHNGENNHEY